MRRPDHPVRTLLTASPVGVAELDRRGVKVTGLPVDPLDRHSDIVGDMSIAGSNESDR